MRMRSMLITVTTAAIGISIGLAVPLILSSHKEPIQVNHEALKATLQEQFKDDLLFLVKEEVTILEKEITDGTATDKEVENAKAKLAALKDKNVPVEPAKTKAPAKPAQPVEPTDVIAVKPASVPVASTGNQVKDPWVQSRIDANRDRISEADLNSGAEIYNSLDTGYLFGLAEGGLTQEEKIKVQKYLRANLADGQYEIAKRLYFEYAGLLNGER